MKIIKIAIIFSIVLVAAVFIYKKFQTPVMPIEKEGVFVEVKKVREETLQQELHAMGTVTAKTVEITPEQTGHVEKIFFQDGQFVKKGEPLIQLDNAIFKAKLESSKAQLAFSENNFKRMKLLGKQGAIAQQAIDQADADLKEKKAAAKESEVIFKKMLLVAPFDGMVGKSKVNVGDYVTVGQSLVAVTDTKHLRIEYTIPEIYLSALKLGQSIRIKVAAQPSKIVTATISFISPTINTENRSVALYAEIENENNRLASGMLVDITQVLGQSTLALMIPSRSLVASMDGDQVYKVLNGKAYATRVVTGKRSNENIEIIQGLASNDEVITDGQMKVKNGVAVIVRENSQ